jgi:NAD(P)-dependent dehydrogenase (short-subunit alcohol dehydrogenase family)
MESEPVAQLPRAAAAGRNAGDLDMGTVQRLKDRVIVVTGAAQGIGEAAARLFAAEGACVALADTSEAAGEAVAASIRAGGGRALFQRTDVARAADAEALVARARSEWKRLDGAFNNAGIVGDARPLHEYSLQDFDAILGVNVRGVFNCLKAEIPALLASGGGNVVNMCSTLGLIGLPGFAAYVASKHAVAGLTKVAALDYARQKIRVNAIAPGVCRTPGVEAIMSATPGGEKPFLDPIPMGRLGEPREIAEVALWLLSDAAPFLTGTVVTADGGTTII